jgi:hypothetical protein
MVASDNGTKSFGGIGFNVVDIKQGRQQTEIATPF